MLTEQMKEQAAIEKVKNGIRLCDEAITKAEKYERLQENPDWKNYLKDLEIRAGMHDREIQLALSQLDEAPNNSHVGADGKVVSSKMDWVDFIRNHKIRADLYREWIQEPESILKFAALARQTLPDLKKKLSAFQVSPSADRVNGGS